MELSCKGRRFMVDFQCKEFYDYQDFLEIMKLLRSPGGCPWDKEQTHASIRRNFLEETCEAVEAIDRQDPAALCEELGDVLMQVVFHADLEEEAGRFSMADVVNGVCQKLVYRHPHVFGDVQAKDSGEVLANWEVLKRKEKGQASTADAVDAVAKTLPALWRAEKIQSKAAKAGFQWPGVTGTLDKLDEEACELRKAVRSGVPADAPHGVREEVGDVLFITAQIAQAHGVDPEDALHRACDKFSVRFRGVEEGAKGRPLAELSAEELLVLWKRAKEQET
jgi:tetrapyrrole methylase family protein/MazG family protein